MFCNGCGHEINENTKFCPFCGKPNPRMTAPGTPAAPETKAPGGNGFQKPGGNDLGDDFIPLPPQENAVQPGQGAAPAPNPAPVPPN